MLVEEVFLGRAFRGPFGVQRCCMLTWPLPPQAQQAAVSGPVGTDFKPLSTPSPASDPPKPTFPAYSQSSAGTASTSTVSKPPAAVSSKPATLTTLSATSKLIHPDEDISLVSSGYFFLPFTSTVTYPHLQAVIRWSFPEYIPIAYVSFPSPLSCP